MFHIILHFVVPVFVAVVFFKKSWKEAYFIMILTMLVDLDHVIATPVYDPQRCSIGFHPLHGLIPILFYVLFCFFRKSRYIGIGLVIHMLLDTIDCQLKTGVWFV